MTRNKKIVISVISILVVLIMLFSVIAINVNSAAASKMFANTNVDTTDVDYEKNFEGDSTINLSKKNNAGSGFIKAAETKSLELYYKKDHYKQLGANGKPEKTQYVRYNVAVYDKAAKKLWTALPDDGIIPFDKLTDNNVTKMQSLVSFNYYDIGKDNNKTSESNVLNELVYESTDSSDGGGDVIVDLGEDTDTGSGNENLEDVSNAELSDIPNGIRISYDLPARSIKFAVDFKINGDSFDVTVPSDQIEEKLEEYTKLKSQRDAVAAEVSRFGESINDIKSLPAYKSLELDQKKQINSRIRTTIESVSAVATQLKTGSSTTERIGDLDGNLFDLQTMLMEFPGFEGVAEKYIETFNGLRSKLSDLDSSSLCGLVSVTPLPYFGCATDKENGYVFYPDKSGAISYFNVRHPEYASTFTKAVYSNYISDIATYLDWTDEEDTDKHETFTTVTMPVFGIKKDNAAFLAIIAEGDADAYIDYNPYSTSTYMNSANASFYMRITTQNTSSEGNVSSIIDSEMVKQNRRIRYKFLSGKDADYAGMAVKYREHLEEFGLIQKSRYLESDTLPLFLSLYMGNKTYGNSVKAEYKSVTTFNEAQNILKDLKSKGVGRINAYMSGLLQRGILRRAPG